MSKETWRIEVRILRLWPTFFPKTTRQSSIEFVCQDEKAGQIQASVPHYLFGKFQQRLVEGSFYRLYNFDILKNGNIQATTHTYRLQFNNSTGVRPLEKPLAIPRYGFKFVEISDIVSGEVDEKHLVDVIAEVVQCEKLNETDKEKIRTTARLRDDLGEEINCTFWSPFAEEIVNRWERPVKPEEPFVLIIQYAMIKDFRGHLTIQNSKYASRLLFDENIPEIAQFKSKINDSGRVTIERIFTTLSSSSKNIIDDFNTRLELKGIKELDAITKEGYFYIYGTILNIATAYNWFYIGCKPHSIKVDEATGKSCNKCIGQPDTEPKFKLTIRVEDQSGVSQFVLFDDHVVPIVKKTASELKHALELDDDFDSFPNDLDQLLGRKCLFIVEVQKFNLTQRSRTYTVKSLSEDPSVINKILKCQQSECQQFDFHPADSTPTHKRGRLFEDCIDIDGDDNQQPVTSKIMKIKQEKL